MLTLRSKLTLVVDNLSEGQSSALEHMRNEVLDLYRTFAKSLLRYICSIVRDPDLAEDAVQEAFLRYFECRLKGTTVPACRAWIFKVARNYVVDQVRAAHSERLVGLEDIASFPDYDYSPEIEIDRAEARTLIFNLLAPRELECLRLRSEGFKYREIASILGIEPGTVGATLARGLRKVHKLQVRRGDCRCESDSAKSQNR